MLPSEYAIERWSVIPPLLTNVSPLPGETWAPIIVFSVIPCPVMRCGITNHRLIMYTFWATSLPKITKISWCGWKLQCATSVSFFFETQCSYLCCAWTMWTYCEQCLQRTSLPPSVVHFRSLSLFNRTIYNAYLSTLYWCAVPFLNWHCMLLYLHNLYNFFGCYICTVRVMR